MPRGGKNHAQGGGKSLRLGEKFSRAQDSIFLPPLTNFSCTPLVPCFYFLIDFSLLVLVFWGPEPSLPSGLGHLKKEIKIIK